MKANLDKDGQIVLSMMVLVIVVVWAVMGVGCADDVVEPVSPAAIGSFVAFSECLGHSHNSTYEITPDQTAIEWEWDGKGTLSLRHANAGANCCPQLSAEITVIDGVITVKESDQGLCYCLCLVNLDYEIDNLLPGTYEINIDEVYSNANDDPLEFTVTLRRTADSGVFVVDRLHYPWMILN